MNGTPTVIKEYTSEVVNNLSDKDIAYLKKDCFKYSTLAPYEVLALRDNQVRIKNTSYSGIIQLENVRVHFSTKVKTNLFYMLSFLRDEKVFCYDPEMPIETKEGANFFDILGRMFLNELDAIFQKGFYKSYIRKYENMAFIKGKMVFKEQLQNGVRRRLKFECSYEDLTYDNLENRIILKATTLLIPLIKFNDEIKRDLIRYSYLLREEVGLTNIIPDDCDRVQFNRLNEYYETAIRFSKVILQNYFIRSTYPGESIGFNFIVNMNKVYEDFITTMVEELVVEDEAFENHVLEKQKRFDRLVEEKEIITRPDVILRRKDSESDYPLIIDAKYKSEGGNSDYYQVIAYSLALPTAKSCCLIYPETEPVNTRLTLVANPNDPKSRKVKLYAVTINLDRGELDFSNYVRAIKKDLKTKILSCLVS